MRVFKEEKINTGNLKLGEDLYIKVMGMLDRQAQSDSQRGM